MPNEEPFLLDGSGLRVARLIRRYNSEGHWASGGTGVRGHMGAYHRTLSSLFNGLIAAGFTIEQLREPVLGGGGLEAEIPQLLVVVCSKGP
jgi:hypothetical protein